MSPTTGISAPTSPEMRSATPAGLSGRGKSEHISPCGPPAVAKKKDVPKENIQNEARLSDDDKNQRSSAHRVQSQLARSAFPLAESPVPGQLEGSERATDVASPIDFLVPSESKFTPTPQKLEQLPAEEQRDDHEDTEEASDEDEEAKETLEERLAREQEESEELARQLMAEEAMASYSMGAQYLRDNADQFSNEDFAALQEAMREEDPEEEGPYDEDEDVGSSVELSYETMLQLGERLGDVKQERWAMSAQQHIRKLPVFMFDPSTTKGKDENDSSVKCLVCQCPYEDGDSLRRLPCGHVFHTASCVDQWLSTKDFCPYCRQSICARND